MSTYPYESGPSRPPRSTTLPIVFLTLLVGVLGFLFLDRTLGLWFWGHKKGDLSASPRLIEARGELAPEEKANIAIYQQTSPAVVHVSNIAFRRGLFNLNVEQEVTGTGTGFVWDDNGVIVTNAHVVKDADTVAVILSDKEKSTFETKTWVTYPDKDLAVLYVNAPKDKLTKIPWIGTSSDLKVGQRTYAIGNPFGLDQTLTTGIVSALGREIKSANGRPIQGVIQTTAAINPGNSGGPLLDSAGHLIGVNTAILSPSGTFAGIGFAIPVDEVQRVVPQLIAKLNDSIKNDRNHEEVSPPRIGVKLAADQLARELGVDEGALIMEVLPGSPAAKAGLKGTEQNANSRRIQLGDVIVAIDDSPVHSTKDLYSIIENHHVGDAIAVKILRKEQKQVVTITLAAR